MGFFRIERPPTVKSLIGQDNGAISITPRNRASEGEDRRTEPAPTRDQSAGLPGGGSSVRRSGLSQLRGPIEWSPRGDSPLPRLRGFAHGRAARDRGGFDRYLNFGQ